MKKSLVALLVLSSLLTSTVYAQTIQTTTPTQNITTQQDASTLASPQYTTIEVEGVLYTGVKDLAQILGLSFDYNNQTKTFTLKNDTSTLTVNLKTNATTFNNLAIKPLNVILLEGTNYIPLTEVGSLFHFMTYIDDANVFISPLDDETLATTHQMLANCFKDLDQSLNFLAKSYKYETDNLYEDYYRFSISVLINYTLEYNNYSNQLLLFKSDAALASTNLSRNEIRANIHFNRCLQYFLTTFSEEYLLPDFKGTPYEATFKQLIATQKLDSVNFRLGLMTPDAYLKIINDLIATTTNTLLDVDDTDYTIYESTFNAYISTIKSNLYSLLAH